jgi:hypothetical protein
MYFGVISCRSPKKCKSRNSKSSKKLSKKYKKKTNSKSICWKGYHRVKGTEPYSKKSCVKNK